MRRLGWIAAALAVLSGLLPARASAHGAGIVDLPVAFNVVNRNASKFDCANFDGGNYVVRGSLVAPRRVLADPSPALTLYLHVATVGQFQWHFTELRDRGYDFAWELAKQGHASVTIDQLGYGSSDHPNGNDLCTGGEADVAHQVVTALRTGAYTLDGGGIPFARVAIAGNSWGGLVAQIEAYSFHDVDGLIEHGINNQPATIVHVLPYFAPFTISCLQGGDGGSGYGYSWPDPEVEKVDAFWKIEPRVWQATKARLLPDSCGNSASNGAAFFAPDQQLYVGEIDVPVLIVAGVFDLMTGPSSLTAPLQGARMTSSPDVTVRVISNQGHAGQFEVTKSVLQHEIESWLDAHSF